MSECERDTILGYSFVMKGRGFEKKLMLKLYQYLILIAQEGISKEKKKEERKRMIGLRCIWEDKSFFLFPFSTFLFHFSI
jgi:hypothetical protein